MRKGSDHFKETIQAKLNEMAETDPLFAESLKKENKNIDKCIDYVISQVKKSGRLGFTDDEIFGMAAHYYDEDDLKNVPPSNIGQVVVNHKPELSEDEIKELKEQARKEVVEAEKKRMTSKKPKAKTDQKHEQVSLF